MGGPVNDEITAKAVVLHQNRAVVGLSPWLAEAAVDAVRDSLQLQIVTPADALVTQLFVWLPRGLRPSPSRTTPL